MPPGPSFLPGVPADHVIARLEQAGGDEVGSGKLQSPESSAALAVNTFGWFIERPERLPPVPSLADLDWPARSVEVEVCARFPWNGGRHPWLDAMLETTESLVGVESKRFEPFRDQKRVDLSDAYDRPVWGERMAPFEALRDRLRAGSAFRHLDAAQLLKHALGLVTEGRRRGKAPVLLYLYAEPAQRGGRPLPGQDIRLHRDEIAAFAEQVHGAAVRFAASSYTAWIAAWRTADAEVREHGERLIVAFSP